jgi:hypothetical protein
MDIDGEICNLQNFGSANAAKECVQYRLPSFAANERVHKKLSHSSAQFLERLINQPLTSVLSRLAGRGGRNVPRILLSLPLAITTLAHVIWHHALLMGRACA